VHCSEVFVTSPHVALDWVKVKGLPCRWKHRALLVPNLSAIVFVLLLCIAQRYNLSFFAYTSPKDVKADKRFCMYRWSWRLQDRVVSSTRRELIIGIICHPQCLTQSTYSCPYHPTAESEANAFWSCWPECVHSSS
jgi:hypothetical protein